MSLTVAVRDLSVTYAQRQAGGRMHYVPELGGGRTLGYTRCGLRCKGRSWSLTSNVPWANLCHNCRRLGGWH